MAYDVITSSGVDFTHCPSEESAVPCVETVPVLARAEVADVLTKSINRINDICEEGGLKHLSSKGISAAVFWDDLRLYLCVSCRCKFKVDATLMEVVKLFCHLFLAAAYDDL